MATNPEQQLEGIAAATKRTYNDVGFDFGQLEKPVGANWGELKFDTVPAFLGGPVADIPDHARGRLEDRVLAYAENRFRYVEDQTTVRLCDRTIRHMKNRRGWVQTRKEKGDSYVLTHIEPEQEGWTGGMQTIIKQEFKLVKDAIITDHRSGERVRELWYEER